ncbi:MAG: hypothetical protein ACKOC5_08645, partial [Chloroflexota bacterium]
ALQTIAALQTLVAAPQTGAAAAGAGRANETPLPTPAPQAAGPGVLDERLRRSARILLFEDMSASRQVRLIKQALDEAGYFYLDVGSAQGWFKSQLLSGVDWDVIIAGAEAEREFGGEFYQLLQDRLDQGASLVIENWDLDAAPDGRASGLLGACGVEVEADWYMPDLPVFFWTDPGHPLFNQPNRISTLSNARPLWSGDKGDLMRVNPARLGSGADPQILASLNRSWVNDHGLIVSCLDGRMLLQTFRSHEYDLNQMVALWQNYVYQSLKSRLRHTPRSLPTPALTYAAPEQPPAVTPPGPTPGPDYTFPHPCGAALTVRVTRYPIQTPDLFEHHAVGTFVVVRLEIENLSPVDVPIWDDDYFLQTRLGERITLAPLHKAATGYLYIESPTHLVQDVIPAGATWNTSLAFDVDPTSSGWKLLVRPGSEFDQPLCQVSIPLGR